MINVDEAAALVKASGARLVAIDGLPLAGKSTLAERLEIELGAACLYLDDFVRPEADWPSPHLPAFPFPYIRYDEFLAAVESLARGERTRMGLFDWTTGGLGGDYREIDPAGLVVVEGVSALHPRLAPLYDLRIWVESDAASVLEASLARGAAGWEDAWRDYFLPSVDAYLATDPRSRSDIIVAGRGA